MSEATGITNCPEYRAFHLSGSIATDSVKVAEHHIVNSVIAEDSQSFVDAELESRQAEQVAKAKKLLALWLEEPEEVYDAMNALAQKPCEGDCNDCPFVGVNLTVKQRGLQ